MAVRQQVPGGALRSFLAAAALILISLAATPDARAANPLGFYIGAEYGRAHIRSRVRAQFESNAVSLGTADLTHSGYQVELGVRPVSLLGAEITYMDFGRQAWLPPAVEVRGWGNIISGGQASQKGEAAFALLYLPIPIVSVYLKAGLSRITTDSTISYNPFPFPGCTSSVYLLCVPPNSALHRTDTSFAEGAGLQWQLRDWALRAEYERFDAAGANPTLAEIGITWTFP